MSQKKFRVAIALNKKMAYSVLDKKDYEFLQSFAEVNPIEQLPDEMTLPFMETIFKDADACITCWGTPSLTEELLNSAPKLKLMAHAAGSIKHMVPSNFWGSGRRLTSNAPVIAEDVAQTVLSYILFVMKGAWVLAQSTRSGEWSGGEASLFVTRRLDGLKVGVVGASNVGKETIKILKPYNCNISLYDPLISDIEVEELGVCRETELNTLIAESDILTLHAPPLESCRHMINKDNAHLIKDGAFFINTARGMLVDETALIKELETGRFFACLDVTDPEPPPIDHPFRKLQNVVLLPHVAGGHTVNGRTMLGRTSIREIFTYLHRGYLRHEVRQEMLDYMA